MRIKFRDNVDLSKQLSSFKEIEKAYELVGPFGEFCSVNKDTREISQYGYNGLMMNWYTLGLLEEVYIR